MAEDRKIDFKITILWALLQAFEELLTLSSKEEKKNCVLVTFVYKHLVTLLLAWLLVVGKNHA